MKRLLPIVLMFCAVSLFAQEAKYKERTVIVKVKSAFRSFCSPKAIEYPGMSQLLDGIKAQSLAKMHPEEEEMGKAYSRKGIPFVDLSLVYELHYNESLPVGKVISSLLAMGIFEYAEPSYIFETLGVPNDPSVASQWHLAKIKAYQAWDITQGDTNIVVGMVDTGIELTHGDLAANIKYNYNDPIDGADNDNDGYIDNFMGWDLAGNDNNPSHEVGGVTPQHGTWSSSSVAEIVNNGIQGAGVGYKTKILVVKAADATGSISFGYQGIKYAADHGCDIINVSWGTPNSWSQYGQEVINYATINKDALVVAAAGNSNDAGIFYPASFDYVLSVGGSDTLDHKWIFSGSNGSNYNEFIDLLAPSMAIYGCQNNNGFVKIGGGTSFGAPMVAAAGALLKAIHPEYSALKIGELLKNTTDAIDTIAFNNTYVGKLGSGRLNVLRALTINNVPGFIASNLSFTDNADNIFVTGDTIRVKGAVTNYLVASSAAVATVTCSSPYVTVLNGTFNIGALASAGSAGFSASPFTMKVEAAVPSNTEIIVVMTFTDGSFVEKQAFKILLNPDYVNMDVNNLVLSLGSTAKLGYMAANKTNGSGLTYKGGDSYIYEMGFMVSNTSSYVSYSSDGEFTPIGTMSVLKPGLESDKDINGLVNDNAAGSNKLGIEVQHKTLGWNDTGLKDFIIQEYKLKNVSGIAMSNVYAGLYVDWDLLNAATDVVLYDTASKIAYGYEYNTTSTFAGTKALTNKNKISHYAFDGNGQFGSINAWDGFSDAEMKTALTNGNSRVLAGVSDIADLLGQGPFNLANGDSVVIAFALIVGDSLQDLIDKGKVADSIYTSIRSITATKSPTAVKCKGQCNGQAALAPIFGVPPFTYSWDDDGSQTTATASALCSGTYVCTVKDAVNNSAQFSVTIAEADSLLALSLIDTNAASGSCNGTASVLALGGKKPFSYLWNDGNHQTTYQANTLCKGSYSILVTDAYGCTDSLSVVVKDPTGIDVLNVSEFSLYPNPSGTEVMVQIKADFNGNAVFTLFDIAGRKILSQAGLPSYSGGVAARLDVSGLESGVYLLRVSSDGVYRDMKLSVSR